MKFSQAAVLAMMAFQANAFLDTQIDKTTQTVTAGSGGAGASGGSTGNTDTQTGGNGGNAGSSVSDSWNKKYGSDFTHPFLFLPLLISYTTE